MNLEMEATQESLTHAEREQASNYLAETRNAVLRETAGLSEAQWHFKEAPDRWSIAEIVEHLAIVGNRIHNRLAGMEQAPSAPPDRDSKAIDASLMTPAAFASKKFKAPDIVSPTGRLAPAVALQQFLASDASIDATLQCASGLRGHLMDHPALGPFDGYQWILLCAVHIALHAEQIRNVKAHPNYPPR